MPVKAVQVLEETLNVQAFTRSESLEKNTNKTVEQPSPTFFLSFFPAQPMTAVTNYALAQQRLGTCLDLDGHPKVR